MWSKTPPTKPGLHWLRDEYEGPSLFEFVLEDDGVLRAGLFIRNWRFLPGQFTIDSTEWKDYLYISPCPFCGGSARATCHDSTGGSDMWCKIECYDCEVSMEESDCIHSMKRDGEETRHIEKAVNKWNRRVQ